MTRGACVGQRPGRPRPRHPDPGQAQAQAHARDPGQLVHGRPRLRRPRAPDGQRRPPEAPYDFDISGFFRGNLDTLTSELHGIHAMRSWASRTMDVPVRITIDGSRPFGAEKRTNVCGDEFDSPLTRGIAVEVVDSSTGLSDGMFCTVTTSAQELPELIDVDVEAFHTSDVTTGFDALGSSGLRVPVWGATELPPRSRSTVRCSAASSCGVR